MRPRVFPGGPFINLLCFLLIFWACFNTVTGIGNYPIHARSEARYARTTQMMVNDGNWLIPRWKDNQPRLEKPPLIHWVQKTSWLVFGPKNAEMALRMPSVLSTLMMALMVFLMGRWYRDQATGGIGLVMFLSLPIVFFVGRIALIDALMSMFWVGAVFCYARAFIKRPCMDYDAPLTKQTVLPDLDHAHTEAYQDDLQQIKDVFHDETTVQTVDEANLRDQNTQASWLWAWGVWVCMAGVLLSKGTPAIITLAIIIVWRIAEPWIVDPKQRLNRGSLSGEITWWTAGPLLALAPLGAWLYYAYSHVPQAMDIWFGQVKNNDHAEGFWYFIPVFIAGIYPAWAFWSIPGVHTKLQRIKEQPGVLFMVLASLLPVILFSIPSRKLATYLLPVAAPVALLAAWWIRRWLDLLVDHSDLVKHKINPGKLLPDGIAVLAIGVIGIWIVGMVLILVPNLRELLRINPDLNTVLIRWILVMVVPVMGVLGGWFLWRKAKERLSAMIIFGAALCFSIMWGGRLQQQLANFNSTPQMVNYLEQQQASMDGEDAPLRLVNFEINDKSLSFYSNQYVPELSMDRVVTKLEKYKDKGESCFLIVDAEDKDWPVFQERYPDLFKHLAPLDIALWFGVRRKVLLFSFDPERQAVITLTTQP